MMNDWSHVSVYERAPIQLQAVSPRFSIPCRHGTGSNHLPVAVITAHAVYKSRRIRKTVQIFFFWGGRGGVGFLDLAGSSCEGGMGDRSPFQWGPGAEPLVGVWWLCPQKLKKHSKLYTFEKYFVCNTWCQSLCSTQIYTQNVGLQIWVYQSGLMKARSHESNTT